MPVEGAKVGEDRSSLGNGSQGAGASRRTWEAGGKTLQEQDRADEIQKLNDNASWGFCLTVSGKQDH